jgi:toxin CptA
VNMTTERRLSYQSLATAQGELERLLNSDPAHVYSEDELDAIEELDPELALRLDRAQTMAARVGEQQVAEGPIDLDEVLGAIEEARRILMQDGGDIEFVELDERVVRVRFKGACVGCPRSALDLKNVVERLVRSRAPGVAEVANTF